MRAYHAGGWFLAEKESTMSGLLMCPVCRAPDDQLQACARTWYPVAASQDGGRLLLELGEVVDVDAEAELEIHCEACGWSGMEYALR